MKDLSSLMSVIDLVPPVIAQGRVKQVVGLVVEGNGPGIPVGSQCLIEVNRGAAQVPAEVVGFRQDRILLMPLGEMRGIEPGSLISMRESHTGVPVGDDLLGRVIDGLGSPMDGGGPLHCQTQYPLYAEPLNPMERDRILEPVDVGIRAVNGLLTIGKGQRIGILAGSGVGKSTLLGMVARHTAADVSVIALIGERGRELKDFIERDLGPEGFPARWLLSPPVTSRLLSGCAAPIWPWRSRSISGTRAGM